MLLVPKSNSLLIGKIGSIFDGNALLVISKIISMNFSLIFWHFLINLSVSHDFENPQMNFGNPQKMKNMQNFTKIIKNQQMLIFGKIPSTVLLIIYKSTSHFNFKENKQQFIILWHLKDNWWKKISWFFDFFQFPKESLWKFFKKKN